MTYWIVIDEAKLNDTPFVMARPRIGIILSMIEYWNETNEHFIVSSVCVIWNL